MEREKKFEEVNQAEFALASDAELEAVARLQQENLGRNVSEDDKATQGFVSVETPMELLKKISDEEGITVARVDGKVAGYIMPITVEHGKHIPLLEPFIARFKNIQVDGRPLAAYRHCIIGQICIDAQYRGQGIFEQLYQELGARLAQRYDVAITEVGANNPRSLHAHTKKAGLKVIEQYTANGQDWYVLLLDFRPFRKLELPAQ